MSVKNTKLHREQSHTARFFWGAIVFLSVVLLFIILAKFVSFKTLFWLE